MKSYSFYSYPTFGSPMPTRTWNDPNAKYKYGFNGKEKDNETTVDGWDYDYGARIYDSRLGRFLSVDPLSRSYPWYSSYQFAGNKPVWAIDIDGLEEYYTSTGELIGKYGTSTEIRIVQDNYVAAARSIVNNQNDPVSSVLNDKLYNSGTTGVFKTNDEAAIDWAKRVNPISINSEFEYGSTLFEVDIKGVKYITYSKPGTSSSYISVDIDKVSPAPKGTKRTGTIHAHGDYFMLFDNDELSPEDGYNSCARKVDSYVSTPNGSLKKFDVECDVFVTNSNYKTTVITTTISKEIPSDPSDPTRQNYIDPDIVSPVIVNQSK